MKQKSYNDVMQQLEAIRAKYTTENGHYKRAEQIATYYTKQIGQRMEHPDERLGYEYRTFVPDTSLNVIKSLAPRRLEGLWFDYNGEKLTPRNLYFGCDTRLFRSDGQVCGKCFTHYDNALRPVCLPNGKRFIWYPLANINAYYENGIIHGYHRQ